MTPPFRLGLTGSVGMGKSTTARIFAEEGVPVWDADAAVHRLYSAGGAAVAPIAALCPDAVRNGAVDRGVLRAWLAEDENRFARLEEIVHPLVAADRAAFLEAHGDAALVVLDMPLLFETGAERLVDAVAVVTTSENAQRARVLKRPGMTAESFGLSSRASCLTRTSAPVPTTSSRRTPSSPRAPRSARSLRN